MAYSTSAPPALVSQRVGSAAGARWMYYSTDAFETVAATDYFSNGSDLGMVAGDIVDVVDTAKVVSRSAVVTAVTAGGAATIAGGTMALTASGAVTAGKGKVTLNHASVVIAATIADFAKHQGIFTVSDTSGSGTAAHTLTLTAGTFDGTSTIATLNAPGERLTVLVDGSGNGTILENTGSVALS